MKLCAFATRAAKLPEGLSIFHPRSCGASSVKKVESGMPRNPWKYEVVSKHCFMFIPVWEMIHFD